MDSKYSIFGRVIRGYDTILKIENLSTVNEKPNDTVKITHCGPFVYWPSGHLAEKFSGEDLLDFNFKMDKQTRRGLCEKLFDAANPMGKDEIPRADLLKVLNAAFEDAVAKKLDLRANHQYVHEALKKGVQIMDLNGDGQIELIEIYKAQGVA